MLTIAKKRALQCDIADSRDFIRVRGACENKPKDVSAEILERRLTVSGGVSGSGESSLVFATIAAEPQRMINETDSAFNVPSVKVTGANRTDEGLL